MPNKPFSTPSLVPFTFYLEPELLNELRQMAKGDRRSISSTINIAIQQLITQNKNT